MGMILSRKIQVGVNWIQNINNESIKYCIYMIKLRFKKKLTQDTCFYNIGCVILVAFTIKNYIPIFS